MAQKKSPGAKSRKNCIHFSSIFDVEALFQRYLPKSEILAILADSHLRRESTLIFQKNCALRARMLGEVSKIGTVRSHRKKAPEAGGTRPTVFRHNLTDISSKITITQWRILLDGLTGMT